MNRIEQVATLTPAQQATPRRPRALTDIRRRAAQVLFQSGQSPARPRRGTSGLAAAVAALAVPLFPNPAFGAAQPEAPQARHHHFHHDQVDPGPGTLTVQGWTASGWTLTVPSRPADTSLWSHILTAHHDGRDVPWLIEPYGPLDRPTERPIDHPRPVILPDGTHGEIAAYQVPRTSPRPEASAAPQSMARARIVPGPLITNGGRPANTKQMLVATSPEAVAPQQDTAADPSASPCLRTTYLPDKDPAMVARLHPVVDVMNAVVTQRPAACGARVDYLSQARA